MTLKKCTILIVFLIFTQSSYADVGLGCKAVAESNVKSSYELYSFEGEKKFRTKFSLCENSQDKLYFLMLELLPASQEIMGRKIQQLPYKEHHLMVTNLRSDIWIRKIPYLEYNKLKVQFSVMFDRKTKSEMAGVPDEKIYYITRVYDQRKAAFSLSSVELDGMAKDSLIKIINYCENGFLTALKSNFEPSQVHYFD